METLQTNRSVKKWDNTTLPGYFEWSWNKKD